MKHTTRTVSLILISSTLFIACACKKEEAVSKDKDPLREPRDGSHYVSRQEGNKGVIVFVHGAMGGDPGTWTNPKTKAYWPELLTKDSKKTFEGFDVYTFEYNAPLSRNALTITELARQLETTFRDDNVFDDHEELIFLCHSMGGIVVREYLQNYQDRAKKISFIYFFSTPTQGLEITRLIDTFSKNPVYGELIPLKRDTYLANQLLRWTAAGFKIPSYCAYETEKTSGVQIVTMASATALCPEGIEPLAADHIQIVKPENERSKSYITFRNAFNDMQGAITFPVSGLTLGDAIKMIVSSDHSEEGGYKTRLKECDNTVLGLPLRGNPLKAKTRVKLIEMLPRSLEDPDVTLKLAAKKRGGYYEIYCGQ